MAEFKFPTEEVELPSKGLIYPEDSPLSSGKVEIKYMTAKEEDILSNQSYIQKGIVLEKLLRSVIVSKDVNVDDLVVGDKNALLIATRILGYGKDYEVTIAGQNYTIDLSELNNKEFDDSLITKGVNEFSYTLPSTNVAITYKVITGRDEKAIDNKSIDNKSIDEDNTDGSIFAFDEESVTDGIQVNLGHTDETVLGEDAWNISLEKDEDSEPTIHENARPVPILRLKSKRAQRRRQIPTENFTPISKEELDDGINPILESQRITIGQSSSKFPLFLITFILGVLIFAFVAAC